MRRRTMWATVVSVVLVVGALILVSNAASTVFGLFSASLRPIQVSELDGTWVDGQSGVLILSSDGSAEVSQLAGHSATGATTLVDGRGSWRLTDSGIVQIIIATESRRAFVELHAERRDGAATLVAYTGDPDDPRSARVLSLEE